jgi:hypothetical protein
MSNIDRRAVYRSKVRYVHLMGVAVAVAVLLLLWHSPEVDGGAVVAGLIWLTLAWRAGIVVFDNGVEVRRFRRAERLGWSDIDAFLVSARYGASRSLLSSRAAFGGDAISPDPSAVDASAPGNRAKQSDLVVVVTQRGARIKAPGTAATMLDRNFPAQAAAALNAELVQRNPAASGAAVDS